MHIVPAPGLPCFENFNGFRSLSSIMIISSRWWLQIQKILKKMQSGLGNMISMSPSGKVSFERGVENSQKSPQTNSFWDIGTQWFFSHSNKKKLNFEHFYNGTLCLKTIRIIIQCTLSLHLACYALRIPTDFKAVQVSSSSSGGHCRLKKKKNEKNAIGPWEYDLYVTSRYG